MSPGAVRDQIMIRLQIEPEFRGGVDRLGKKPGGFRGHASLPAEDLVDSLDRSPKMFCQSDLS
jgi:hypothetical protein